MDQNVSASPGDADNLVRKKPVAQPDATASGGVEAAAAKAKAGAQAAGRTEFMASNLSTVRDASKSGDPTPVSLPRLQPIVGVNPGAVTASDLTSTSTPVQGAGAFDGNVAPVGSERPGKLPPVIAKVNWHDLAPPSGSDPAVVVPPTNGSVSVEGTASANSPAGKGADSKNLPVADAQTLHAGISPSPPPASGLLTTAPGSLRDQVPLKLNINFQPTNSSEISSAALTAIASGSPLSAQTDIKAKIAGATGSLSDKSAPATNALSLGNLFETNSPLSQTGLLASTGATIPDAVITQYHPPLLPTALTADASRLTGTSQNGLDASLTRNITFAGATGNATQSLLSASISPYNVAFSASELTANPVLKPGNLLTGGDQLGQKPPLQLALANSVPLGTTDYSGETLPAITTVSLRPAEFNASTSPLVLQTNLNAPSADFRPTRQELSTTPIVLSVSLTAPDSKLALPAELPPLLQTLDSTQGTSPTGHSSVQRSNLSLGELQSGDATIGTATPVTLTTDLLRTTGDITADSRVPLISNTASATSGSVLLNTANFPLSFAAVEATAQVAPFEIANRVQLETLPTSNNARTLLISQTQASSEAVVSNIGLIAKRSIFDQSRELIASGSTTSPLLAGQADFSPTLLSTKSTPIETTSITAAANANALYRLPSEVAGALFQPNFSDLPPGLPPATLTGLSGSIVQVAEFNIPSYSANSPGQSNLSLGTLPQPDAFKPITATVAGNSHFDTPNDAIRLSRTADISNSTNLFTDQNLTAANYVPPAKSFEPVQLASLIYPTTVEPSAFTPQKFQAAETSLFGNVDNGQIASSQIADPSLTLPPAKTHVGSGMIAPAPPLTTSSETLPITVSTSFSGSSGASVFHINDDQIIPVEPSPSNAPKAYLAQGSDSSYSALASALHTSDADGQLSSTPAKLSLGNLPQAAEASASLPVTPLVAKGLPNATTFDTTALSRTADISSTTNVTSNLNLTSTNFIPPAKSFEPVQIASLANPTAAETVNFNPQKFQTADTSLFGNVDNRQIASSQIADLSQTLPLAKTQIAPVGNGMIAPAPLLTTSSETLPITVSTSFSGSSGANVFHINDDQITPVAPAPSNPEKTYLAQGNDPGNSALASVTRTSDANNQLGLTPAKLSFGNLPQAADATASVPVLPLVANGLPTATTFDTTALSRTADISSTTNVTANLNLTSTNFIPPARSFAPVQLASLANPTAAEPVTFTPQKFQTAETSLFGNSSIRDIGSTQIADPSQALPPPKIQIAPVGNSIVASNPPSTSSYSAALPNVVSTSFSDTSGATVLGSSSGGGASTVFHINDGVYTPASSAPSALATTDLAQAIDKGNSAGRQAFLGSDANDQRPFRLANLSLGDLPPASDATATLPSGSLVAKTAPAATAFDTTTLPHTADISMAINVTSNSNWTSAKPADPIQLSLIAPLNGDQAYLSARGTQLYQSLNYATAGALDFSTSLVAEGAQTPPQSRDSGTSGAQNTVLALSSSSGPSSYDALPFQAKPSLNGANINQPISNDYASAPLPISATVSFRAGSGDSSGPPITVQVADLRSTSGSGSTSASNPSATEFGITPATKLGTDLSRSTVTAANSDLLMPSGLKPSSGTGQSRDGSSFADAQNLVAKMGQNAVSASSGQEVAQSSVRALPGQEVAQSSGGYARLSTGALANSTVLNSTDVHALPATAQTSNLTGLAQAMPFDGTNKTTIGSLGGQANPLSVGPLALQEAPKASALLTNDRLTATNLEPSLLVGAKTVIVLDNKGVSTSLDQTLHPVVAPGPAPAQIGELGVRPVAGNLILLDLTHAPLGPGGLDPGIRPAVTVVKPPDTDLTGVKTIIVGQILTGRLPDGTALRPDPNGIIFSVKGAGAEVDPAGNKLLTINSKIELIVQTTTSGIVGTTTGIISGSVNEINIIGLTSTRAVRIGSDALVDSTHATITGNPAGLTATASGKGNPLVVGGANNDPSSAATAGLTSTNPTGQPVPPNSAAGSQVAPLGSGNPDEDKNNNGVTPGNTGVVVGNTVVPLPNVEFFDGKLSSTRIVATSRTEEVVNDTLVHGALPPLAGIDQALSDLLAARNGKQDPGIPNFDSNLSPISVFGDPKRFEPTGGIASTRFGDEIADGKEGKAGRRVDLGVEEGQVVDPKIHNNSAQQVDLATVDSLTGKKEIGSQSEIEQGTAPRPDASKAEDSELSDDVRNQMTTLLTDQSENLTGVSDRRTVKDFIDELLHHTKRRSYRIDSGDTLEKLARRILKDKRLAHLIYLLNEDLLGNQADLSNIQLRAGQVLIMPSIEDVLQYRIHILHDVMPPHIYKNIIDNPDERIVGSSKLLRATYSCRFGDRLTSIAARHSAIRDEKLWTLIAQLNGLSTLTDSSGQPRATLKRAQKLILPSRKDIEDHFRRSNHGLPAKSATEIPSTPFINPAIEAIESAVDDAEERATVNWGVGDDLPTPLSALARKDGHGSARSNRELGPDSASKAGGKDGPTSKGPKSRPRRIEPNEARIVAPEDLGEGTKDIYLRLEFEYEGKWLPVIEYTGTEEQIYLHVYTLAGRTDSIPIALPTRSIRELAECDLGANYQRYCQRFLAGDRPI